MFEMSEKNDFGYLLFVGPGGVGEVSGEEPLRSFKQDSETFLMDYAGPGCFTGRITAEIFNRSHLKDAVRWFGLFSKAGFAYPNDFETNLKAAAKSNRSVEQYVVRVEADYTTE
jgi:hypothetical protein